MGRTEYQQNCAPRKQVFLVLFKISKTRRLNVSLEARTSEILCTAEGVGHFSPKPNTSRTAKAERRKAKSRTADAIYPFEERELSARTDVRTSRHSRFVSVLRNARTAQRCPRCIKPRNAFF